MQEKSQLCGTGCGRQDANDVASSKLTQVILRRNSTDVLQFMVFKIKTISDCTGEPNLNHVNSYRQNIFVI